MEQRIYRRIIDISRDNLTEAAVSPMVLINYAGVLRQLDRIPQSADYAERAYSEALTTSDELVINQSFLERSRIYLAQHDVSRAESMLAQVEPRIHKALPPRDYAFAAISRGSRKMAQSAFFLRSSLAAIIRGGATLS